jgi:hypothetical protein
VSEPYELVSYEPHHRDDYLGLLREAWGEGSMSPEEFDWWFDRNPEGSLRSLAVIDGRVVGVAAHTLLRMALGGEERRASFSVHATTHVSARGLGIFAALERRHEKQAQERGAAVVLAFASPPTAPIFLGPLGWTEIDRLRVWARPLRGLVLRGHAMGMRAGEGVERFRESGDRAAAWPNHVVRDARHLNWRYVDSPWGYRALETPAGYAAVRAKLHRGVPIAVLADLQAPAREARSLVHAALGAVVGCRAALALPAREQRPIFASLGFAPTPYTLHFIGKSLAGALDPDPRAWRFTLGDTDFF